MSVDVSRFGVSKHGESRGVLLQDFSAKERGKNTTKQTSDCKNSRETSPSFKATPKTSQDLHPKDTSKHDKDRISRNSTKTDQDISKRDKDRPSDSPKCHKVDIERIVSESKQTRNSCEVGPSQPPREVGSSQLPLRESFLLHSPFITDSKILGSWRHSKENMKKL
eukprot:1335970-Amorphochlora_amoeboformis.AAC.2